MQEIEEPTLLQAMSLHRSEVTCVDASYARLATGGGDRTLRLWRWVSGSGWDEVARATDAHRYGVTAARWAASGVLLASGGVDGAVRVWCGRSLVARRLLAAPGATATRALCWAGRARLLAGHDDGALCVWHVPRGQLLARLHEHEGALHAVAAPALGSLLLTACTHGVLKVFDLAEVCQNGSGELLSPTPLMWMDNAHDLGALCADATEDGKLVATGGQDSLIRVWRTRLEGARPCGLHACGHKLWGHTAAVTALRWAGGGANVLLASGSLDRTARLWVPDGANLRCQHVVHAHPRYLTCVALSHDLRYMVTGSNDKSLRMWSLGSLTLDDELELPCAALNHFALGDLKGIGPVESLDIEEVDDRGSALQAAMAEFGRSMEAEGSGSRRLWHSVAHAGAINCIATHGDLVATASSDGQVRVFRWSADAGVLDAVHVLDAHQYPATAVDFGAAGAVLLTAGLDGRACLWDVESGVQLRSLCVPASSEGAAEGEAGGGGVRAARCSAQRCPLMLLATDDGLAPLWSLATTNPKPLHVYAGNAGAVTCCAWSADARVAALGAAGGELRVLAPPAARLLYQEPHAHDLGGVQSCDFATSASALELPDDTYLLATGGCDSLIKMWIIQYNTGEEAQDAAVKVVSSLSAHGGGVSCVRWRGALLGSAGADRWVRVWQVSGAGATLRLVAALPVASAGGALCVALLGDAPLLLTGSMSGELAVWMLPTDLPTADEAADDEEGTATCFWNKEGVARWLREYITRVPGSRLTRNEEDCLIQKSLEVNMTGSKLLSTPVDQLLEDFGYAEPTSSSNELELTLLREELGWLQLAPPPYLRERDAPHMLLCPLTHRLMREPALAADGYTYERANILDWFIAADSAVSPLSGRRLRNARVLPNYAVRAMLRHHLQP